MHVKAKTVAFCGVLLAMCLVFMTLGSVIETSTLFLLAAASYFVGIVIREFGMRSGAAFYLAAVLLGLILAPNRFYVLTFGAMGFYILGIEGIWRYLEKRPSIPRRSLVFWISKYVIFNIVYLPIVLLFRELLLPGASSVPAIPGMIAAGQIVLFLYDRSYDYVQAHIWSRLRGRLIR